MRVAAFGSSHPYDDTIRREKMEQMKNQLETVDKSLNIVETTRIDANPHNIIVSKSYFLKLLLLKDGLKGLKFQSKIMKTAFYQCV